MRAVAERQLSDEIAVSNAPPISGIEAVIALAWKLSSSRSSPKTLACQQDIFSIDNPLWEVRHMPGVRLPCVSEGRAVDGRDLASPSEQPPSWRGGDDPSFEKTWRRYASQADSRDPPMHPRTVEGKPPYMLSTSHSLIPCEVVVGRHEKLAALSGTKTFGAHLLVEDRNHVLATSSFLFDTLLGQSDTDSPATSCGMLCTDIPDRQTSPLLPRRQLDVSSPTALN